MKKVMSGLAIAVIASLTTGVTVGPAEADTPRCVTHKEFKQIRKGMTKQRVHRIFDVRGRFSGGGAGGYVRWYGSCASLWAGGGDVGAYVEYNGWTNRVAWKRWF